jgi:hypothetical protein
MSKYKNINSSIVYYVLTITLAVSIIGTHTHLLALVTDYSIIRLYCFQPKVLSIILTRRYVSIVVCGDDLKQIFHASLGEIYLSYLGALKDITSTYNRMAH